MFIFLNVGKKVNGFLFMGQKYGLKIMSMITLVAVSRRLEFWRWTHGSDTLRSDWRRKKKILLVTLLFMSLCLPVKIFFLPLRSSSKRYQISEKLRFSASLPRLPLPDLAPRLSTALYGFKVIRSSLAAVCFCSWWIRAPYHRIIRSFLCHSASICWILLESLHFLVLVARKVGLLWSFLRIQAAFLSF